ncbi:MAG: DNA methyltransferase [Hyphomicrobium sp.]|nr:DNA methyltransferase [Hyphomicrobium sp.]
MKAPNKSRSRRAVWADRRDILAANGEVLATLYLGDCAEVMSALDPGSVHSVVTDPPYELGFMGKSWDAEGGVASQPETWARALDVLKPGGHLTAFAGSRTYHRIASAIDDAGFEIRDQLMWIYGSGFPKSLDVAKALDKRGGGYGAVGRHAPSLTT